LLLSGSLRAFRILMTHPLLLRALLGHLDKQTTARVRKCGFF
jgi:hypothetical protein